MTAFIVVAGDARQFAHGAGGDDDGEILFDGIGQRLFAHRNAETVSGSQGDQVFGHFHLNTLQYRARFVSRGGKGHLLDHFLEIRQVQFHTICPGQAQAWAGSPGRRYP